MPLTIFIVDDDEFYQEHLRHHIATQFDCDLKVYRSGEACVDSLFHKPDIIFLDYALNDDVTGAINGREVLKRILKKIPAAKVVMVSGYTEDKDLREKLLNDGAYDFIAKDDNTLNLVGNVIYKTMAGIQRDNGTKKPGIASVFLF